jgi:AraC-like DNA-binding protein
MRPLQYQKQLRLQEARRLLMAEGLAAAMAGLRAGYKSLSHFSRDYGHLFGAPPARDIAGGLPREAAARTDARDEAWRTARAREPARPECVRRSVHCIEGSAVTALSTPAGDYRV